jgi:hypothetical protein
MNLAVSRIVRRLAQALVALLVVYAVFLGVLFAAMCQPPDRFGRFMAKVPGPAFMVIPFEPMWNVARGGTLNVGDMAPDFELKTADRKNHVQLASFRGKQPVVLVFGSYT